ncbi:MAG: spore maturation protein [Defluviitaleaceae bacterium]|nr:spore maturation protein [Defluviitaleaceae bacterium]
MRWLMIISDLMIPLTFASILLYGLSRKVPVYDTFIEGAKDGFTTVLNILPTIIGLMIAVGMVRASGFLDILNYLIAPLTDHLGYPTEAVPLTIMRLISSAASTGLLLDLFERYGPDSFLGRFVSIMMSSTETVVYTMSVYFMSLKITKTRFTLAGALFANLVGIIASLLITIRLYS